jgi:hypothetical protein
MSSLPCLALACPSVEGSNDLLTIPKAFIRRISRVGSRYREGENTKGAAGVATPFMVTPPWYLLKGRGLRTYGLNLTVPHPSAGMENCNILPPILTM